MLKNRLRALREVAGLTVREAAARLERSPGYISRIEGRGEIPTAELLCQMADLYGADPQELFELASQAQLARKKAQMETEQDKALRLFRRSRKRP